MLTFEEKKKICVLRDLGKPIKKIALDFGVSSSRISQITLYERDKIAEYFRKKSLWIEDENS